jgi:hypothetical protein
VSWHGDILDSWDRQPYHFASWQFRSLHLSHTPRQSGIGLGYAQGARAVHSEHATKVACRSSCFQVFSCDHEIDFLLRLLHKALCRAADAIRKLAYVISRRARPLRSDVSGFWAFPNMVRKLIGAQSITVHTPDANELTDRSEAITTPILAAIPLPPGPPSNTKYAWLCWTKFQAS